MTNRNWIFEKISKLNVKMGWSIYTLADRAGMNSKTIYDWKNKDKHPTLESLDQISGAFGITTCQLLARDKSDVKRACQSRLIEETEDLTENQIEALIHVARSFRE